MYEIGEIYNCIVAGVWQVNVADKWYVGGAVTMAGRCGKADILVTVFNCLVLIVPSHLANLDEILYIYSLFNFGDY